MSEISWGWSCEKGKVVRKEHLIAMFKIELESRQVV